MLEQALPAGGSPVGNADLMPFQKLRQAAFLEADRDFEQLTRRSVVFLQLRQDADRIRSARQQKISPGRSKPRQIAGQKQRFKIIRLPEAHDLLISGRIAHCEVMEFNNPGPAAGVKPKPEWHLLNG